MTPSFDGRSFGGVLLAVPAQEGGVELAARAAWAWDDGSTRRAVLEGDVKVGLAGSSFVAERAVVWAEPRAGSPGERQVAVYFVNLREARATGDAGGAIQQTAERLLVVARVHGDGWSLRAESTMGHRPEGADEANPAALLAEGEQRFSRYLTENAGQSDAAKPTAETPAVPGAPGVEDTSGVINFFSTSSQVVEGSRPGESAALLSGGMTAQLQTWDARGRVLPTLQLTAERAVVFLKGGAEAGFDRYKAENVEGIYLEGDVNATNGQYTLRGARVYLDVKSQRAIVLDAVFWTYDAKRGMPIYLRADTIRQESRNQWSAEHARVANVAFAEPHFAIGATSVTITRKDAATLDAGEAGAGAGGGEGGGSAPGSGGDFGTTEVDARWVSFDAGGIPLAFAPRIKGEIKPSPLKRVTYENYANDNVVRSTWDMHTLFGVDAAAGNEFDLRLDGYFERGVGVGPEINWRNDAMNGAFTGYFIHDNGTDHLTSGDEIDHDGENRGWLLGENIWRISDKWTLFSEGSYISDETFVDAFFEREAETRREFTNSLYARRMTDNDMVTAEIRGSFNDFISNEYLLQSLGYQTEKLPEVGYLLQSESLFGGVVSYSGEAKYSRLNLNFSEPKLRELGFNTPRRSRAGFGLLPNQSLADVLEAQGLNEDAVNRFDSRHEIEVPLTAGPVNVVPFAVGRFTAYDTDFDDFDPRNYDPYRLWGAGGLRLSTAVQHVDDSVRSEFFDLTRLRHILEPSVTGWHSGTTIDQTSLPIYDDDVESLANATTVRAGVRNTWQTQRGGEGHLRSVDWLTINTDYVWSSGEADIESPFGRFIEARPEHSNMGRFFTTDAVMNVTDAVALTGSWLFDTEEGTTARSTGGIIIDHGEGFTTYYGIRQLDPVSSLLMDFGARYELTRKHAVSVYGVWDPGIDKFQSIGASVTRRFPQWTVSANIDVDEIADDFGVSVTLRPVGLASETRRRIFTRDEATAAAIMGTPKVRDGRLDYGPFKDD